MRTRTETVRTTDDQGMTERLGLAEALRDGDGDAEAGREALALSVAEPLAVRVAEPLLEMEREALGVPVAVTDGASEQLAVALALGDALLLSDADGDAVPLGVPLGVDTALYEGEISGVTLAVGDAVVLAVPDGEEATLGDGVALGASDADAEMVPVALSELDSDADGVADCEPDNELEAEIVTLPVTVGDAVVQAVLEGVTETVPLALDESEGDADGELETVPVALGELDSDAEGAADCEPDATLEAELETLRMTDDDAVTEPATAPETDDDAVVDAVAVSDGEADGEADAVASASPCGAPLDALGEALSVADGEKLADSEEVAVALALALKDADGESELSTDCVAPGLAPKLRLGDGIVEVLAADEAVAEEEPDAEPAGVAISVGESEGVALGEVGERVALDDALAATLPEALREGETGDGVRLGGPLELGARDDETVSESDVDARIEGVTAAVCERLPVTLPLSELDARTEALSLRLPVPLAVPLGVPLREALPEGETRDADTLAESLRVPLREALLEGGTGDGVVLRVPVVLLETVSLGQRDALAVLLAVTLPLSVALGVRDALAALVAVMLTLAAVLCEPLAVRVTEGETADLVTLGVAALEASDREALGLFAVLREEEGLELGPHGYGAPVLSIFLREGERGEGGKKEQGVSAVYG